MPKPDTSLVGAPCWAEIFTSDQAGARRFYGELFGWEATEPIEEFGGYFTFTKDGAPIAGCMGPTPDNPAGNQWAIYLRTTDAQATTDAVAAHGGTVLYPPMPVGDLGTMANFLAPDGAPINCWQPAEHAGFGVVAEPNAPAWFEAYSRKYEAAVAFYRDAFGVETKVAADDPDFRYTVFTSGGEEVAGVMDGAAFLPEGVDGEWAIYFNVEDIDASIAKAVELGATVLQPSELTPYGYLALLADPAGSRFKFQAEAPEGATPDA